MSYDIKIYRKNETPLEGKLNKNESKMLVAFLARHNIGCKYEVITGPYGMPEGGSITFSSCQSADAVRRLLNQHFPQANIDQALQEADIPQRHRPTANCG